MYVKVEILMININVWKMKLMEKNIRKVIEKEMLL